MSYPDIESFYRSYIGALNRRDQDLSEFVLAALTYNGKQISRLDYEKLIAENVEAIPDLHFDVDILVATNDQIACRLWFVCTPEKEFFGFKPNGTSISFSEHVFYKLRNGKISEVWSLLDRPSVERQLNQQSADSVEMQVA